MALREEPRALALRGVAMAQLGEDRDARRLLARAARGLARARPRDAARCLAALGEVALAARDLRAAKAALDAAHRALTDVGDAANALFVAIQRARCAALLGDSSDARRRLDALPLGGAPPALVATAALVEARVAGRELRARDALDAARRARAAARRAGLPALEREVDLVERELGAPAARLVDGGVETLVDLAAVERACGSGVLVVDGCRRRVIFGDRAVDLVSRPVLLALALALGARSGAEVAREDLAAAAFGARRMNDSIRARLRVEIGRLRRVLGSLARLDATARGFALHPRRGRAIALLPPADAEASAVLALLGGGEAWSTSALAAALGASQRSVQRALVQLRDAGRVEASGRGRACRWVAAAPSAFATTMLLLAPVTRG